MSTEVKGRHNKIYRAPPTPPPEVLLEKEKTFVLDCKAVSSISSDYSKANPKLGQVVPPYNSQQDGHVTAYFGFQGVQDTLKRYKQVSGTEKRKCVCQFLHFDQSPPTLTRPLSSWCYGNCRSECEIFRNFIPVHVHVIHCELNIRMLKPMDITNVYSYFASHQQFSDIYTHCVQAYTFRNLLKRNSSTTLEAQKATLLSW